MSNENSDLLDEGLQAVMGKDRCQNDWFKPKRMEDKKPEQKTADAVWEPVKAVAPMDKLKGCAKWSALFGLISGILFYWQQAGLLDSRAAVPSFVVCALLAGLAIGWNAK